jgi:hypothetical protein
LVKLHKFKNILVGGSSVSQDGIGGHPPTSTSLGGNSFRTDIDYQASVPRSWTSMLAKQLDPDSFTNVAVSANGMVATCTTICDMLEKFNYSPQNTLVIFNVTPLGRLDVKVDYNNDNDYEPWTEDILNYSFLKCNTQAWKEHLVDTTIEQIEKDSVKHLEKLFEYLYNNQYPFVFTLSDNISELPMIQKYKAHLVPLEHIGMIEFCSNIGALDDTQHPSILGYTKIAQVANKFITQKYINTHD